MRTNKMFHKKLLLAYVSYPATTAWYIERSFRKKSDVVTMGPAINEQIIRNWNLKNMTEKVAPHDIPCGYDVKIGEILGMLPEGWSPDLFLWVESVPGYFPGGIQELRCPTACYMVDSHINLTWHLKWALQFDYVFLAQKEYVPAFQKEGCQNVIWLPLACDPDIHGKADMEKRYDICFVGSLPQQLSRRKWLLDRLGRAFNVHIERSFHKEMARTFSASKIVFNNAIKNDLNMRVFEGLVSGSMLLTDRAPGSGLDSMFKDREHLVIYSDDKIEKIAEYYLTHVKEREEIARRGREEVLSKHTYDHRMDTLLQNIFPEQEHQTRSEGEVEDTLILEGKMLSGENKFKEALEKFELAGKKNWLSKIEKLEMHNGAGNCLLQLGKEEEGEERCQYALEIDPSFSKPYTLLSAYYCKTGEYEKAVDIYERYLEFHPADIKAIFDIAELYLRQGRKEKAREAAATILLFEQNHADALDLLERIDN